MVKSRGSEGGLDRKETLCYSNVAKASAARTISLKEIRKINKKRIKKTYLKFREEWQSFLAKEMPLLRKC